MNDTWVTICGNVVGDPQHRQTAGGARTAFRIASTPRTLRDGQWTDGQTSFYDVICWRNLADNVAGSVMKGQPVVVHGRIAVREWATDTSRGREVEITADHIGHDLKWGTSAFARPTRLADVARPTVTEESESSAAA